MAKVKPINLEIGGIGCQIFAPPMVFYYPWQLILKRKYAPFLKEKIKPKIKIYFKSSGRFDFSDKIFKSNQPFGQAVFHLGKKEAEISPFLNFPFFDFFFRYIFGLSLPSFNGFMFHASSLGKDGKAYIFAGDPGSGKSTIVKLSRNYQPLADDSTIVRRLGKKFFVFSSPFYEKEKIKKENLVFPLWGVYFLVKGQENYLTKLSPSLAVGKLIASARPYLSGEFLQRAFPIATELAKNVPCYTLYFYKSSSFWEVIDEG